MAEQNLEAIVQRMIDAGESEENIGAVIQAMTAKSTVTPVAADEPDTYLGGFVKGMGEGMVGGAKGFAKGLVPGVANAVVETVKSPVHLAQAVAGGGYRLYKDPLGTLRDSASAAAALPGKVKDTVTAGLDKAATDPEAFGSDVANMTAAAETGILAGRAIPLAPKPMARGVGRALEKAGTKGEWPMQVAASHQVLSGNPAGLAVMAIPSGLRKVGRGLQKLGGADLEVGLPSGARNIDVGEIKSLNVGVEPRGPARVPARGTAYPAAEPTAYRAAAKAADKADANAARLADIEDAKADLTPGASVVRESTAATRPDGSKASKTQTYKPKEAPVDPNGPPPGWPAGVPYDPSKLGPIQPLRKGPRVVTLTGPARPQGQSMGQAATAPVAPPANPKASFQASLAAAEENALRNAPYGEGAVLPSNIMPTELRDQALEGLRTPQAKPYDMDYKGVVPDFTFEAGQADVPGITVGKAASDVAQGRVPTGSKARVSDTRMDEMVGKFGGQPSAKVPTKAAIPASKSKGAKSATPGLTRSDLEAVGLNPDLNYTNMTPAMIDRIKTMRASRHTTHYNNARTDRGFQSLLEEAVAALNKDRLK